MTGKALYELHQQAWAEQDERERGANWDRLSAAQQMAWNRTAELLWGDSE